MGVRNGVLKVAAGTNPAANTEVSETVPAEKYWKLLAISVSCVQGATQTPQPVLQIDDGATVMYEMYGATGAQGASSTARYSWVVGGPQPAALVGTTPNIKAVAGLPDMILPPGARIRTSTVGIGANTDYGAPQLTYIEYDRHPDIA